VLVDVLIKTMSY